MEHSSVKVDVENLKVKESGISSFIQKFISVLMSIITGCVMIMLGFIWNIRSEFAEEKKEREFMQKTIEEVRSEVKKQSEGVVDMRERMIRVEEKTKAIEEKVEK